MGVVFGDGTSAGFIVSSLDDTITTLCRVLSGAGS